MRGCVPCLCAASAVNAPGAAAYASGNWAALRETINAPSKDTVKDLLTPSVVPTRHFQRSLPKLPLPSLQDTLQRYLAAVQPLCSPSQHEATVKVVRAFKEQEGPRLQDELRRTDKANLHTSFISSDLFECRLKERHPLPLHSHKAWLVRPDGEKADMLVRSAYWLWASVHFYKLYLDNQLAPEVRYSLSQAAAPRRTATGARTGSTALPRCCLTSSARRLCTTCRVATWCHWTCRSSTASSTAPACQACCRTRSPPWASYRR